MITMGEVLRLHELSVEIYGGANGVRDMGLLASAVARPFQTFGGNELYLSAIEKAAAIAESIILNHPFIDGNKRTGFLAMFALLEKGSIELVATESGIYEFVINISTGKITFDEIVEWLQANTKT
jgi:death on curing protein